MTRPAISNSIGSKSFVSALLATTVISFWTIPTAASAQAAAPTGTQGSAPAPQEEVSTAGDEIVVTAQRREQRLQDVPISITALGAKDLDNRNVNGIDKLESYVPNIKISTGTYSTEATIAIRGGVELSTQPQYDPAVGIYVDGVYIAKSQGNTFNLADLERIEVLRGPQGTLYGRNTFAGAINLITQKPTGEFGGNVKLGIGDYGQRRAKLSLNLPAFGDFSVKLSALFDRVGGYVDVKPNPFPNVTRALGNGPDKDEASNSKAARVAVRYNPRNGLVVDYSFEYNDLKATPRGSYLDNVAMAPLSSALFDPASASYSGALVGGNYLGFPANLYLQPDYSGSTYSNGAVRNIKPSEKSKVYGHTLTASYDVGDATLKSISSLRKMDFSHAVDLDGTPLPLAAVYLGNDYHQGSQEFQLTGKVGIFNYTTGIYYFHEHGDVSNLQQYFGNTTTSNSNFTFGTDAYAAYAQVDAAITDKITATGGLRYSHEKKTIAATLGSINETTGVETPIYGLTKDQRKDSSFTPTAILKYDFTTDANVYLKYARGFKSGGLNLGSVAAFAVTRYAPEFVDSYELGTKLRFNDGAIQLNADVFFNKVSDQQVTVFRNNGVLAASVVDNAAESQVWGAEADFRITASEWLRLTGSAGYLHPEYKNYIDAGVDVSKLRASTYAPKFTAAASAEATLYKGDFGSLFFTVDFSHTSPFYVQAFDLRPRSATVRSSAQTTKADRSDIVDIAFRLADVKMGANTVELSLWSKNVFNAHDQTGGIDFGASFGNLTTAFYNRPRTIGADATLRF